MELLLFILPVFFALSVLVMPQSFVRVYGLLGGLATLVVTIGLICTYNTEGGMHLFISKNWIPQYGLTLNFGYDAVSLMMLVLTSGLVPLILLSNYKNELASNRLFTSMVFFMQLGLIGVFVALLAIPANLFFSTVV